MKEVIESKDVAAPIGSYSQTIKVGNMVFVTGQVGVDKNGQIVGNDVESQSRQVFKNIELLLKAAGASPKDVVKITCFITERESFAIYDKVRREFFKREFPSSSTVVVKSLANAQHLVEVEAIAVKE
jgi:2-iminobutanoate/2-iminopropanoate deaminase